MSYTIDACSPGKEFDFQLTVSNSILLMARYGLSQEHKDGLKLEYMLLDLPYDRLKNSYVKNETHLLQKKHLINFST